MKILLCNKYVLFVMCVKDLLFFCILKRSISQAKRRILTPTHNSEQFLLLTLVHEIHVLLYLFTLQQHFESSKIFQRVWRKAKFTNFPRT